MDFKQLIPGDPCADPATTIQTLLRAILVRTNLVPGLRHAIGWRGLQQAAHNDDAWTARIAKVPGVFGLFLDRVDPSGTLTVGIFGLNYFPQPAEAAVESLCVRASLLTQQPDYYHRIRAFMSDPQMVDLFNIASLTLVAAGPPEGLQLILESVSRQQVVAMDGVRVVRHGETVQVVEPGQTDQDFPALETALAFFEVLAASVTFNLSQPPTAMTVMSRPGRVRAFDASGRVETRISKTIQEKRLALSYGGDAVIPVGFSTSPGEAWRPDEPLAEALAEATWWRAHLLSDCKALDKSQLGIDERPQLIVVSGFLGAGKTSFVQHFLEYQTLSNRFVAVIQNEIGTVGLDGRVLDQDYAVVEIDEGCICCSLVGNLKKALRQIMSDFHPDFIVLETTGLANPLNLLDELSEVADTVRFDSVTTVVDGLNLSGNLSASGVARDQIRAADIILLNKRDQMDAHEIDGCKRLIAGINPHAPIFTTAHGDINPALLYGAEPSARTADDEIFSGLQHTTHRHEAFRAHTLNLPGRLTMDRLSMALNAMPRSIFRIKGIVDLEGADGTRLVQYVAGRYEITPFNADGRDGRYLVFIGKQIDPQALSQLFMLSNQAPG